MLNATAPAEGLQARFLEQIKEIDAVIKIAYFRGDIEETIIKKDIKIASANHQVFTF